MKPGQVYTREDGAVVRVDFVEDEIYFVSWAAGQERGCPKRMVVSDFQKALETEKMEKAMQCPHCKRWIYTEAVVCPFCGKKVKP